MGSSPEPSHARRYRGAHIETPVVAAITAVAVAVVMLLLAPGLGVGLYVAIAAVIGVGLATIGLLMLISREVAFARMAGRAMALAEIDDAPRSATARLDLALTRLAERIGAVNHRLANRHAGTGLVTREPLFAAIAAEDVQPGSSAMLGVVDFVDFDRLNTFDAELAERARGVVAERIMRMIGRSRLVAQVDRARIAIWFGAAAPPHQVRAELDAINYALAEGIDGGEGLVPVVRIGCAASLEGDTPQALLTRAIANAATANAAPAATVADPITTARSSFGLEQDLRQAVTRDQFRLAFQPLVDATGLKVSGAEALLRWQHPDHGMIAPSDFVPLMESAGLSDDIGLWVLNAACREAWRWRSGGLDGLRVAVNVSGHQLEREDLAMLVERTLARHKLPGPALEIELTETVAAADADRAKGFFAKVRQLGVAIAIDDFGTGFSSLSTLRQLGFDKLKIDREFVSEVDTRRDSQAICQSIIALGRGLGIRVLAEGVERFDEYRWLRRHGCTLFQGYYFAPPLAPEAFRGFVHDRAELIRKLQLSPDAVPVELELGVRV